MKLKCRIGNKYYLGVESKGYILYPEVYKVLIDLFPDKDIILDTKSGDVKVLISNKNSKVLTTFITDKMTKECLNCPRFLSEFKLPKVFYLKHIKNDN